MTSNTKGAAAWDEARDMSRGMDMPGERFEPVEPGADALPGGVCRGLLVGTAGTADLTQADGTDRDGVPLQAGYNPLMVLKVRAPGSADHVWALD